MEKILEGENIKKIINNLLENLKNCNKEELINKIEDKIIIISEKINKIEDQMHILVQKQTGSTIKGVEELKKAKEGIESLFDIFENLKKGTLMENGAECSELDELYKSGIMKKNLKNAINTLELLNETVSSKKGLRESFYSRDYQRVLKEIQKSNKGCEILETYKKIGKILKIIEEHKAIKQQIVSQLCKELDASFSPKGLFIGDWERVETSCIIIQAGGVNGISSAIELYTKLQLYEFRAIFGSITIRELEEIPTLLEEMINWLKKRLSMIESDHLRIFPTVWSIIPNIVQEFSNTVCNIINKKLNLKDLSSNNIIKLKEISSEFEKWLKEKYEIDLPVISDLLDSYFGVILRETQENLHKIIIESMNLDEADEKEERLLKIFPSAMNLVSELVIYFKKISELSKKAPLVDLISVVFYKTIKEYVELLLEDCQRIFDSKSKYSKRNKVAFIIYSANTFYYLSLTVAEIKEMAYEILHPFYKEEISFEIFFSICNEALDYAVNLVGKIFHHNLYNTIIEIKLSHSSFISVISRIFNDFLPLLITLREYDDILDKVLELFIAVTESEIKESLKKSPLPLNNREINLEVLKNIKEIKNCFFNPIKERLQCETIQKLKNNFKSIELFIDAISIDEDNPIEFVNQFIKIYPFPDYSNFELVLIAKGLKGNAQLINEFLKRTSNIE